MPAHDAGLVDVSATTFLGGSTTAPGGYSYGTTPSIIRLSPATGGTAGGTTVTIAGTNLAGTTAVTFGGSAATGVTVLSPTSVRCVTPPRTSGAVTVALISAAGPAS